MAKTVKIGGEKREALAIEYKGKTYNVPLSGSMKRKDLQKLKDEDAVMEMFAQYIPMDILEDMTVDEYRQLAEAWVNESQAAYDIPLGES